VRDSILERRECQRRGEGARKIEQESLVEGVVVEEETNRVDTIFFSVGFGQKARWAQRVQEAGTRRVGDENNSFLAETLSKLRFFWYSLRIVFRSRL
jgi:hypothetical protein